MLLKSICDLIYINLWHPNTVLNHWINWCKMGWETASICVICHQFNLTQPLFVVSYGFSSGWFPSELSTFYSFSWDQKHTRMFNESERTFPIHHHLLQSCIFICCVWLLNKWMHRFHYRLKMPDCIHNANSAQNKTEQANL